MPIIESNIMTPIETVPGLQESLDVAAGVIVELVTEQNDLIATMETLRRFVRAWDACERHLARSPSPAREDAAPPWMDAWKILQRERAEARAAITPEMLGAPS